jgi:hypothetical protein
MCGFDEELTDQDKREMGLLQLVLDFLDAGSSTLALDEDQAESMQQLFEFVHKHPWTREKVSVH